MGPYSLESMDRLQYSSSVSRQCDKKTTFLIEGMGEKGANENYFFNI